MSFPKFVQFLYPVEFILNHTMIWASTSIDCYVAFSTDGSSWTYLCGEADHTLDSTGKLIETLSEAEAITNFWTTGKSDGVLAEAEWPWMRQCKYVRVYFNTSCTIYEIKNWVYLLADELKSGIITSKTITLSVLDGGGDVKIQSGKTDFGTTASGFIIGIDDSDENKPKFEVGGGTKFIEFDGVDVKVGRDSKLLGADAYNNTNIYYHTFFDTYDNNIVWVQDAGTIAFDTGNVRISTTGADAAYGEYSVVINYSILTPTWVNNRRFKTKVRWSSVHANFRSFVGSGADRSEESLTTNYIRFGFYLIGNALYGLCCSGAATSTIDLSTVISINTSYLLEAVFTAGSKVEFYVDGVYKNQLTTNLPTGTDNAGVLISYRIWHYGNAEADNMSFSEAIILQE